MDRHVEFLSDGDTLRGTLFGVQPDSVASKEIVVMSVLSHLGICSKRPDTNVAAKHASRFFGKHLASLERVEPLEAARSQEQRSPNSAPDRFG